MSMPEGDALIARIHDLVTAHLEGRPSMADRQELDALVESSPEARRVFAAYMEDTARLRWLLAAPASEVLGDLSIGPQPSGRGRALAAAAVACAIAATLLFALIRPMPPVDQEPTKTASEARVAAGRGRGVATLTRLAGVSWNGAGTAWPELSRLDSGDRLQLEVGEVEVVFDTGVEVVIRGPAVFDVRGIDRGFSELGAITARVGPNGQGFVLETPVATVVDLGTEFNIQVAPSGTTEVAVVRGLVDLSVNGSSQSASEGGARRLRQGEGLRVGPNGAIDRVMSIASDQFPSRAGGGSNPSLTPAVIAAVRDNSEGEVQKFYKIVRTGLHEDVPAFVDRNHEWNGIDETGLPAFLQGIEYVMPHNNDKFIDRLELSVDIARPATVYVFMSDHVPVPEWLARDFVDTGFDIGLDEAKSRFKPRLVAECGPGRSIDTVFSVWRREVSDATTLLLGPVTPLEDRTGFNMYGIAATPLTGGTER